MSEFEFELLLAGLLGILLSSASIFLSQRQGKLDLFAPPMLVMQTMLLQYYVPAFTLPYYNNWVYPHLWEHNKVILYPILLASLAWFVFLLAYQDGLGKKLARTMPLILALRNRVLLGAILISVGLSSLLIAIRQSGGLSAIVQGGSVVEGTGVWVYLGFLTIPGVLLLWIHPRTRILALAAATFFFAFHTASQARGLGIQIFILLFIMSCYLWRLKNKYILIISGSLLFAILLVAAVGKNLTQVADVSQLFDLITRIINSLETQFKILINRDIARLEQLSIMLELVPDRVQLFWGSPMFYSLLGPFGKYVYTSGSYQDWRIILTQIAFASDGENFTWGMGGSGVGEWYVNFDFFGVIIGWYLIGVLARTLYEWFQEQMQIRFQVTLAFYVVFLWIFLGVVSEGVGHLFKSWLLLVPLLVSKCYPRSKLFQRPNYKR